MEKFMYKCREVSYLQYSPHCTITVNHSTACDISVSYLHRTANSIHCAIRIHTMKLDIDRTVDALQQHTRWRFVTFVLHRPCSYHYQRTIAISQT